MSEQIARRLILPSHQFVYYIIPTADETYEFVGYHHATLKLEVTDIPDVNGLLLYRGTLTYHTLKVSVLDGDEAGSVDWVVHRAIQVYEGLITAIDSEIEVLRQTGVWNAYPRSH